MASALSRHRRLARIFGRSGGLKICEQFLPWRGLVTLNYHRIGTPNDSLLDWDLWSATEEDFSSQVKALKQHFDVIGLEDLPQVFRTLGQRWSTKQRFVLLTFDDGYRDNYDAAFPILREHNVSGTFFITTGFVSDRQLAWWDEIAWMIRSARADVVELFLDGSATRMQLPIDRPNCEDAIRTSLAHAYRLSTPQRSEFLNQLAEATGSGRAPRSLASDLWMNWDMIREMRAAGMSFGAHTVSHPVLSRLSCDEQNDEICESRLRIEAELGESVTAFSYPVGRRDCFNEDSRRVLEANGFDWAFSYHGGFCRSPNADRLNIPRVGIERDMDQHAARSFTAWPHIFAR